MTRYLEDWIYEIERTLYRTSLCFGEQTDGTLLISLADQLHQGRTLTTRQGAAARRAMRNVLYDNFFQKEWRADTNDLLQSINDNVWKNPLRATVERRREVRHIGANNLAFSGVMGVSGARTELKLMKAIHHEHLSIVSLSSANIDTVIGFIARFNVEIDLATEEYIASCLDSRDKITHMIMIPDTRKVAINVRDDDLLCIFLRHFCEVEDL